MNKLITAVTNLDIERVKELFQKDPKWIGWSEKDGKNALHYLCGLNISNDPKKVEASFGILKLLLKSGVDINSVHNIPDKNCDFPATPLWYAYTRGRNEKIYTYLLKNGADPNHCMFAIAWYDDAKAAALFKKHGASIHDVSGKDNPFLASIGWRKFQMAEWFLKNGADVNFADEKGNTALFYAVKREYDAEHIKMLLKFGADPGKKNNDGISPKMLAKPNKQKIF